jgi:cytochrome c biogenesis factor
MWRILNCIIVNRTKVFVYICIISIALKMLVQENRKINFILIIKRMYNSRRFVFQNYLINQTKNYRQQVNHNQVNYLLEYLL